jgi:hypothetical protein
MNWSYSSDWSTKLELTNYILSEYFNTPHNKNDSPFFQAHSVYNVFIVSQCFVSVLIN